ncbi:hypothetical protein JEQ12_011002 [Ovis aries]|uniref:G-protein coupled receptors family 1 profile domain-containing protein n=1 Tax=Ovis aries TaxID=9940 RepID=A0A836CUT8_SHEEP|nr:hypothetical protein JEQ12_011002 [Ovis aries]
MKASEKTKENQDEKRPKPVFQESSSLYPNLIDLETELSPPPYADPNPPLLPQDSETGDCDVNTHINENYHLIDIGAGTRELEEWEDVTQEMVDATNIAEGSSASPEVRTSDAKSQKQRLLDYDPQHQEILKAILASYIFIISSILHIRSTEGRSKAFGTCSSHISAVAVFYGSAAFMYLQPSSSWRADLIISRSYVYSSFNVLISVLTILISYNFILYKTFHIHSTEGRSKAFSTCSSHIFAVAVFYGSETFMYLQPSSLSCSSTYVNELLVLCFSALNIFAPSLIIVSSYVIIISSVLRIPSVKGRSKAFSTCSSHISAVAIFYGSAAFMYLQPSSVSSMDEGKVSSVFYTIVVPMLNPLIYSLRNRDVNVALKKMLERRIFF